MKKLTFEGEADGLVRSQNVCVSDIWTDQKHNGIFSGAWHGSDWDDLTEDARIDLVQFCTSVLKHTEEVENV